MIHPCSTTLLARSLSRARPMRQSMRSSARWQMGSVTGSGSSTTPILILCATSHDSSRCCNESPRLRRSSRVHKGLEDALASSYRLERELGRGGMATVFLAHDIRHNRRVAIKVLHPELGQSIGPARFLREIQLAARLTHPHIVPLFDSGEAGGYLYYVMPVVDGETLRDRLLREGQLSIDESLQLVRGIAAALDYAHRQNIVHRDIKPEDRK